MSSRAAQTNRIAHHLSPVASNQQPPHQPTTANSFHRRDHPEPISHAHNLAGGADISAHDGPPRKKQRLNGRSGAAIQTTLDRFTQPRPPTRATASQPSGHLAQTVNGATNELLLAEDELSRASPHPTRRRTRSPQPAAPSDKAEDKRTLRSQHDGPRLKSELQVYFGNYEDIIFDLEPKDEEFFTLDTPLYIVDDSSNRLVKQETLSPVRGSKSAANARRTSVNGTSGPPTLTSQRSSSNQFNSSAVLDLDFVAKNITEYPEDPLTDEHFLKSHRRAERKEKQLRNIEKERAMHEKVQLERIRDGLQGHDWLRVLGITGVTDSEARKYETKRNYFLAEVQALVDKFKDWKEQEKKQRLDKEAAAAAKEAAEDDDDDDDDDDDEGVDDEDTTEGSVDPPSSDLNASAARQLLQETVHALKSAKSSSGKGKERALLHSAAAAAAPPHASSPHKLMLPPPPLSPEIPITSFYAKRHLRDAAMGRSRPGRNVTAFGQPLPEMEERDFILPADLVTEETLRANARERRRRKRESAANHSSKASSS